MSWRNFARSRNWKHTEKGDNFKSISLSLSLLYLTFNIDDEIEAEKVRLLASKVWFSRLDKRHLEIDGVAENHCTHRINDNAISVCQE